jgi:pimeloyl-ACP methyl ester carboxylesterase
MRTLITGSIRLAGAVSPRIGAAAALPVFMHVGRRLAVAGGDAPTMDRARRSDIRIPGIDGAGVRVTTYEWGAGSRTIVLAHGWQGRASQFATLVRDLVYEGFRVVAFDAPAHGESDGRHTYLFDWIEVLRALQARDGAFRAIVGHSFGALAALVAAADGLSTERVVTIAAAADADALLKGFQHAMGFDDRTASALRTRFARRFFGDEDELVRISALTGSLSHTDLLVIHDVEDRRVPYANARMIVEAHPGSTLVTTRGLGHSRILASDAPLDAILASVTEDQRLDTTPSMSAAALGAMLGDAS